MHYVVTFYLLFLLFLVMVMYAHEVETKDKYVLPWIKN